MPPTLLDDEDNQDFDPRNGWEDEQYGTGLFPGGGEDDNKNDIASTISAVIPSSRDRAMIAQARIAMFEKSRPAIQGRHVPPSVAVEPKTELHDWTDESKEKFLSHLSEEERQKLDDHFASLLREGLSEEEAWAVSKDTAREDRWSSSSSNTWHLHWMHNVSLFSSQKEAIEDATGGRSADSFVEQSAGNESEGSFSARCI